MRRTGTGRIVNDVDDVMMCVDIYGPGVLWDGHCAFSPDLVPFFFGWRGGVIGILLRSCYLAELLGYDTTWRFWLLISLVGCMYLLLIGYS